MLTRLKNEPAIMSGLTTTLIGVLAYYHLHVTTGPLGAIVSVAQMIGHLLVRQVVSPTGKVSTVPNDLVRLKASYEAAQAALAPSPVSQVIGGVVEAQTAP